MVPILPNFLSKGYESTGLSAGPNLQYPPDYHIYVDAHDPDAKSSSLWRSLRFGDLAVLIISNQMRSPPGAMPCSGRFPRAHRNNALHNPNSEAIRRSNPDIRFYQASSSEMFGHIAHHKTKRAVLAQKSLCLRKTLRILDDPHY